LPCTETMASVAPKTFLNTTLQIIAAFVKKKGGASPSLSQIFEFKLERNSKL
jgi:hypothetical protein